MDACVVSGYLIIYNKKNRHMEQEERMYQVLLEMIGTIARRRCAVPPLKRTAGS